MKAHKLYVNIFKQSDFKQYIQFKKLNNTEDVTILLLKSYDPVISKGLTQYC